MLYEKINAGDVLIVYGSNKSTWIGKTIAVFMMYYDYIINNEPLSLEKAHHTGNFLFKNGKLHVDEMLSKGRSLTDFKKHYCKHIDHIEVYTPIKTFTVHAKQSYQKRVINKQVKQYKYAFASLIFGHIPKAITGIYMWFKSKFRRVCSALTAENLNYLSNMSFNEIWYKKPHNKNPENIKDCKYLRRKIVDFSQYI